MSIGIEVCENKGIDKEAAIDRAALLTALMMLALRIPRENVVSHQFWTGKDCPRVILRQPGKFEAFRERAAGYLAELKGVQPARVHAGEAAVADEVEGEPFEVFGDDTVSPELAALTDAGASAATTFAYYEASGGDDQVAQMERLIGRLTLENHALRQALAQQRGASAGVEPEAD